ncbi:MAG: hypothetical protein WD645_04805 [Dehalococcoidia bacterium]
MADRSLVAVIEGSKGKAEVFEVNGEPVGTATSGAVTTTYEVVCGGQTESVSTLGEASIVAHDLAGPA